MYTELSSILSLVESGCIQLSSALRPPLFGDISLQVCSPSWLSQTSSGGPIHLKVLSALVLYCSSTLSLFTGLLTLG